jgi:Mlc titration factor MtfA (ptsG expression regulator)
VAPSRDFVTGVLVVLAAGALLGGAIVALRPVLLRLVARAAARRDAAPIPPEWFPLIDRQVPAVRVLTVAQRTRLLRAARELMTTRRWEGCGGLTLSTEMQLIIAAQACLLTLGLPGDPYPNLRTVLVYPHTFVPRRARDIRKWMPGSVPEPERAELGEAWGNGIVVLAWASVLTGAADPADGQNLVLHEFAHELAFEHHLTPMGLGGSNPTIVNAEDWRRVLSQSYDRFCSEVEAGAPTVLDRYAATNEAEFFAVATEVFFEKPGELRLAYPELYGQLQRVYRQDPAAIHETAQQN